MATPTQGAELAALRSLLLDTGPLVAYLDNRDAAHDEAASCLDGFSGQIHTSSAVITEAMHFVAPDERGPALLAEFVTASQTLVHDLAQPPDLRAAVTLMEKYFNVPMDYADATLVLLAERLGVFDILTFDRRGFSTYRTQKQQTLRILERA
jgi:predicted nucleic acid-binding protein